MPSDGLNRTILITGATDGIGLALARRYANMGARLVLVGRRPLAELDADFFDEANYCRADLACDDCVDAIEQWLEDQEIEQIDLLIHNAGVGYVGAIGDQTAGEHRPPDRRQPESADCFDPSPALTRRSGRRQAHLHQLGRLGAARP